MDDSAGQTVGDYGAQLDQLGSPQPPSRQTSMTMPSPANAKASGNNSADKDGHLRSLDAIMPERRSSLRSLPGIASSTRPVHEQSYSVERHASDAAAIFDRRASTLAGAFNNKDDYNLLPSRWWFTASAFPMIAGTLGPVASAFSICALVRPWRQEILPGETIDSATFIKDPIWLTCINAVQLAIALAANMFLLLNMARRIRFSIAQPITMVGWYFSSLALIALTSTAAGPLQAGISVDKNLVWSQAFYYAIYAAVLYMLVASLMVCTFLGAWSGHYPKDFQLSNSQRTLMLQTIMFLMYLLLGALLYSHLEGWAFLDAVYWADVTLFTIGFGDFAAQTTLGRALLFPYALIGIISLGLVIGSIRSLALERGRLRLDARMTEKNRRNFLKTLARKGKDGILQPIQQSQGSRDGHAGDGNDGNDDRSSSLEGPRPDTAGLTEYERREEEFNIMRKIQHDAGRKRRWVAMATSGGTWLTLWLLGAYIFKTCEYPYQGWDYFDGVYLAFVGLTTIGYGDVVPISNAGRSFFVFWSLLALPTTTILISNAGDTIVKGISDATNAIGRITILPGEHGLRRDLKEIARVLTCGVVFDDVDIEDMPPGLLGAAQKSPEDREEDFAEEEEKEEEEAENVVDEAERSLRRQNAYQDEENAIDKGNPSGGGKNYDNDDEMAGETSGQRGGDDSEEDDIQDSEKTNRDDDASHETTDADADAAQDGDDEQPADASRSTSKKASPQGISWTSGTPDYNKAVSSTQGDEPSSPTRTNSDTTDGSKKTADSPDQGGLGNSRRSRSSDQLHSSRRGQSRSSRSAGTAAGGGNSSAGYALGSISNVSVARVDFPQELPASRAEYHCVLADEIAHVTQHLRHSPPRKYTFQEWAWFLKLIGEDERNADLHRRAQTRRPKKAARNKHDAPGAATSTSGIDLNPDNEDPSHLQWSWVGARSPLMGDQEEAEWILDKLTRRLQSELRATRNIVLDRRRREQQEELEEQVAKGQDGDQPGGDGDQDPGPHGSTVHLKRRETHPIEEEP